MGRHARRRFPWALVSALAVVALIAGLAFAMANRKSDPAKADKTTTATGTRSTTSSGEATQECADLRLAQEKLRFQPSIKLEEGLRLTLQRDTRFR